MSKVEFMKTSIPEAVSQALANNSMIYSASYVDILGYVTFAAVGDILRTVKTLDRPSAFVFRDESNSIIAGAIVRKVEGSDENHPEGNWSYTWSFDQEDFVMEDMNITDLSNPTNTMYFVKRAGDKYGMEYRTDCLAPMHLIFIKCLKDWLITNAKEDDETEVELANVFSARSGYEDGKVVLSIEPLGKFVQLIKDDADLEV
jgi:hypothetical protein